MKLLYYLPAFGEGNIEIKRDILLHNLQILYDTIKEPFDLIINMYSPSELTKLYLHGLHYIDNLYIYEKKGVLTELFLTNPDNKRIPSYDFILFVLDDVKFVNFDLAKMIEIKECYNIEFLSPKILKSTHTFMNAYTGLTINNFLEVYLLLLTPTDFTLFCSQYSVENKWMWGPDYMFGYNKIRVGVLHDCVADHVLPSKSEGDKADILMSQYFKEHTPFKSIWQVRREIQPIVEHITLVRS